MSRRPLGFMVAALIGASACASSGSSPSASSSSAATTRSNSTTLVAADIQASESQTLYDAIQKLRPEWLRRSETRVRTTSIGPGAASAALTVYVDNNRVGSTEVLNQLRPSTVQSVRYYTASEAQARFGNGNMNGAIEVITISSAKP